jgi:Zn-dependent peptidase ImmA (M78 family)
MAELMPVTGEVLAWALADRELSRAAVASQLKVDQEALESWIKEDAHPTKTQFAALVKLLRCNESFLFLPRPPRTEQTGRIEFRKHADAPEEVPEQTAEAMRTARTVLKITSWLAAYAKEDSTDWPTVPSAKVGENVDKVANRLRDWLGWSAAQNWGASKSDTTAAKSLRNALQRQRIVVLHLTMDEGSTRGFCLHNGSASVIAVNTREHVRARYFSYAHELVHLALRDDSVCLTRNDTSRIERFCNRVAGSILMPEASFRSFVNDRLNGQVESYENVVSIRNYFKVSIQAATIRAQHLGFASEHLYGQLFGNTEPKSKGGTYVPGNERTRPVVRVDQYGTGFVNSLFEAEESGHLRRAQVLNLLRLSDRELDRARELAIGEAG